MEETFSAFQYVARDESAQVKKLRYVRHLCMCLSPLGWEKVYSTLLMTVRHMKTRVAVKVHMLRVGYGQRYPWEPVAALDTVRAHG